MTRRPSIHLSAQYLPLVAKKARQQWFRLPPQTRAWVALEDLIQDGMLHLVQHLLPKHNPKKCRLLTFLWWGLDNFYKNKNNFHFQKSRFDGRTVPLNAAVISAGSDVREVFALSALYKTMEAASPELREKMVCWLMRPTPTKFRRYGEPFTTLRREVLALGPSTGFGYDEMHYLLTNESWKTRSAREVCRVANVAC